MSRLAFAILSSIVGVVGFAGDDTSIRRAEAVAERFVESWNSHAPAEFGEYLDANTDWVAASGLVLRGQTEIQNYLANEHATWARETNMSATGIRSRAISVDAVIVRLEWRISGPGPNEATRSFTGVTQFVVMRTGHRWRVVSGQVTTGRGRAPT